MRELRNVYEILVLKPERERPFGGQSHRQQGSIKIYLKEIE
jgi:hypothetical protein